MCICPCAEDCEDKPLPESGIQFRTFNRVTVILLTLWVLIVSAAAVSVDRDTAIASQDQFIQSMVR